MTKLSCWLSFQDRAWRAYFNERHGTQESINALETVRNARQIFEQRKREEEAGRDYQPEEVDEQSILLHLACGRGIEWVAKKEDCLVTSVRRVRQQHWDSIQRGMSVRLRIDLPGVDEIEAFAGEAYTIETVRKLKVGVRCELLLRLSNPDGVIKDVRAECVEVLM